MHRRHLLLQVLLCALSALLFFHNGATAQTPVWFTIQDSIKIDLAGGEPGYMTDPNTVWAFYEFRCHYGLGSALYTFTEARSGTTRLELRNWEFGEKKKTYTAPELSNISRTRPFTLHTGDTIQFYREFAWFDPTAIGEPYQTPNNYYAKDTIEFVVELIDNATGVRIARLDSLGILRQIPAGYPHLYGNGPAMYIPKYKIPAAHNGKEAYIGIRLTQRGDGEYDPLRYDYIGINLSAKLTDPCFYPYYSQFNGVSAKTNPVALQRAEERALIKALPIDLKHGVRIRVDERDLLDQHLLFAIYDTEGKMQYFASWVGGEQGDERDVVCQLQNAGAYILGLYSNGELQDVSKIVVQ